MHISLSNKLTKYERSSYTLFRYLEDAGGLYGFVLLATSYFAKNYNEHMFQTSVFKNMPVKKKSKKSKTNNSLEDDLHSKLKKGRKLEGLSEADIANIEEEV